MWNAPTVVGGTPVIDYRVYYDQGTSNYIVLAEGIKNLSYTTSVSLTANTVYKFLVESRNAFGYSTSFSNEVSIRAAAVPTLPRNLANNAAVTASGTIGLSWVNPISNGGSPVIDYQVSYKTSSSQFSVLATGIISTTYTAS